MAGWVQVDVQRPVYRSGGGALKAQITAAGLQAAADVRHLVRTEITAVVAQTVRAAGPGSNRAGWPIGPPRPWEPGHVHSFTRFQVMDLSRGWYIRIDVTNPAPYLHFIHAPKVPSENVYERELGGPIADAIERLKPQVADLIRRAIQG